MTDLLSSLSTLLTAGVGGVTFVAMWSYMVLQWLASNDFWLGNGGGLGWWWPF